MKRRTALKSVALSIGALAGLPSWAASWNKTSLAGSSYLSKFETATLSNLVQTIIPKTDTPGAGDLHVDQFVQLMVKDCYDENTQKAFREGLVALDTQSKTVNQISFPSASEADRKKILEQFASGDDTQKSFYNLVKNLTIQGFMSSEYVMTNITHYELVPARYHGCVPLQKG
jgi:hypothetical protein